MTGRLYDAATLERWNVVNRVVADDDLEEKGMAFARELAAGPTRAHTMTKRIVRAYLDGGIERADEVTPGVFGELFATDDLQNAVKGFLAEGPGKATFKGEQRIPDALPSRRRWRRKRRSRWRARSPRPCPTRCSRSSSTTTTRSSAHLGQDAPPLHPHPPRRPREDRALPVDLDRGRITYRYK